MPLCANDEGVLIDVQVEAMGELVNLGIRALDLDTIVEPVTLALEP
jgi:hypothetical protein